MFLFLGRQWRKLRFWLRREQLCRELAEELDFHTLLKQSAFERKGLTAAAAHFASRREMGNMTFAKEQSRDFWTLHPVEELWQDVRYAARTFRRNPAFTAIAILSLALGIAGNIAIFSIINALLIQPLPFPQPDRLLRITELYPKALLEWFQQQCRTIDVASVSPGTEFNLTGDGPAVRVTGSEISVNLFPVLGVTVAKGRGFESGEDRPGSDGVVIISNELWRTKFHRDPEAVGRTITLAGVNRRIVGIMPAGFSFPSTRIELWLPARIDPARMDDYWGGEFVPLIARLRPRATIAQARSEIHMLAGGIWKRFPFPMPRNWAADATVISLQRDLAGDTPVRLFILLGAVAVLLLIACANVASLLLARATTRRKEIAMRNALGAGSARLVRQLLTESVVLALAAGMAGIFLGSAALSIFRPLVPPDLPTIAQIGIDWRVAAFALVLSLLTGLAFGTVPAISASQSDLIETMKTGSQRSTTRSWIALRSYLIGTEIALTLVLALGAGLLLKSLYALTTVDPGFNAQRVVAVKISPNESFCTERAACVAFYNRLLESARGVRGVIDAAIVNAAPLDGELPAIPADVEDHPKTADFPAPMLWTGAISPGYLRLLQIPLVSGREFTVADGSGTPPVVLVTASTAKRFWPGENAIGKHIKSVNDKEWRTVVGVVADIRQFDLENHSPGSISGSIYMPYAQAVQGDGKMPAVMNLVVKIAAHTPEAGSDIQRVAAEADPGIPAGRVRTLTGIVQGSISSFRSTISLFLCFAAVAMTLAAIGIYGLLSYSVSQRTYEISLRMAVGATTGSIVRMMLRQSLRITLAGLVVGLAASFLLTRFLSALLFNVTSTDPLVYSGVSAFLLLVAVLASLIPARRAARIDPIRTLRAE
jgi:predicted permease